MDDDKYREVIFAEDKDEHLVFIDSYIDQPGQKGIEALIVKANYHSLIDNDALSTVEIYKQAISEYHRGDYSWELL